MSFIAAALVVGVALTAQRTDAPKPEVAKSVVDFGPLFDGGGLSYSVAIRAPDAGMMDRLLLSPNLVFESSRSSLGEPDTVGGPDPKRPAPDAPNLLKAYGNPVDIRASSILLDYLQSKGSVLIAPAVTRRWSWEWYCTDPKACPQTTWVERLLLMKQKVVRPDESGARGGPVSGDEALRAAPTSMLAVRDLGQAKQRVFVVVEDHGGQIVVRRSTKRGEPTMCPGLSIDMPVTSFSAEILSMVDGRIVSRVHESRFPKLTGDFRVRISRNAFEPVRATESIPGKSAPCGFLGIGSDEPATEREYVSSWSTVDTTCPQVQQAFALIGDRIEDQLSSPDLVREVLKTSLDGLYR